MMVMAPHLLSNVLLLWKTWNLHGFVLLSMCLQILLLVAAPFRIRTKRWFIVWLVWLTYQLVGTAIDRSLALVRSSGKEESGRAEFADLYTLWAAFLVLHFGGPDTITALAMEDNNLWGRVYAHVLVLIVGTVDAVLGLQLQKRLLGRSIIISTTLILVAGMIKSIERFVSLQKSSFEYFRMSLIPAKPNPVVDYASVVDKYEFHKAAGVPMKFVEFAVPEDNPISNEEQLNSLNEEQLVIQAHHFFNMFKGMYVDMVYCCHDRKESRKVFLHLSPRDAFKIVEIEMKFAYEAFYTKMPLLSHPRWLSCRWISFGLELVALILWSSEYKHNFRNVDIEVTRCLFYSAVITDIVGFLRFYCSDHTIARSAKPVFQLPMPFRQILHARGLLCCGREPNQPFINILFRQWSESISQFNFIDYCIDERYKPLNDFLSLIGAKDVLEEYRFVTDTWLTNELKDFIFQEVRCKSLHFDSIWEDACSFRGRWILQHHNPVPDPDSFEPWIMGVEYDQSVLIWHIATELCYQTDEEPHDNEEKQHRMYSKNLSDYMSYLLLRQPNIMSAIAPATEIIFRDTCSEAREFFHEEMPNRNYYDHREVCIRIMQVPTDIPPSYLKSESKSVLFDACRLAKYLIQLKTEAPLWKLTSQIWVELLCYAAVQTPGTVHVIQLCAGGELLTLIRILMLHLGLSKQFRRAKRIPRADLVFDL